MCRPHVVSVVLLSLALWSGDHAMAQEPAELAPRDPDVPVLGRMAMAAPLLTEQARNIVQMRPRPQQRSGSSLLNSLLATNAIMQALDVHSTVLALNAGASDGNPLMAGITGHRGALIATKVAVTTSTILAVHKVGKRNKLAAIVTALVINGTYVLVVRHNYRVARGR